MQPISGSLATTHTSSRVASSRAKRTARISAVLYASIVILAMCTPVKATTFTFNTAPFAGTNVLNTPGRQVVGGEFFISFFPANDVFSIDSSVFGVDGPVNFVNATAGNLPTGGVNVVVLQTFDNDANPLTPFGAGNAADLIASRITTPGAGFFIYFNQSLDIPRLVYSTDLSSNTADLRILARVLNLNGDAGRAAIPTFSASNFEYTSSVPEPSTFLF
ncbi:MAG: hypothetical protein ABI823_15680, partial [Bryobacteraceae bacterium]